MPWPDLPPFEQEQIERKAGVPTWLAINAIRRALMNLRGFISLQIATLSSSGSGITQLTGDVTAGPGSGSQAATIANDAVTNAKAANMTQSTIKGRAVAAGTGDPTDLTATQATAILDVMIGDSGAGGTKGVVAAPAAGDAAAGKFWKADGSWAAPSGTGAPSDADYLVKTANGGLSAERVVTDTASITTDWGTAGQAKIQREALTGDVTAAQNSNATTIANNAVSDTKLRDGGACSVIGRSANSSGDPADISASANGQILQRLANALVFSKIGIPQYIVAASDDSDSDNTVHDDPELVFAVSANEVYIFELLCWFNCGASNTPDMKVGINLPSGTLTNMNLNYPPAATLLNPGALTDVIILATGYQQAAMGPLARGVLTTAQLANTTFYAKGVIRVGASGGNAVVSWAQNTTTGGNPLVRKADSYLCMTRIA